MPSFISDLKNYFAPHWSLNNICYQACKKSKFSLDGIHLSNNYLMQFIELAQSLMDWSDKEKSHFKKRVLFHAGEQSTYKNREEMRRKIKVIYARLSGLLDEKLGAISKDEKCSILSKLSDNILDNINGNPDCTPGFDNRLSFIESSFFMPASFAEILMLVRESIVEDIYYQESRLAKFRNGINGTHLHNDLYKNGENVGLGIYKINEDVNLGDIADESLQKLLASNFSKKYRPFSMAEKWVEILKTKMQAICYVGEKQEKGYVKGEYEAFISYLNKIFNRQFSYEYLWLNENGVVTDLNWPFIKSLVWRKFADDNYLDTKDILDAFKMVFFEGEKCSLEAYSNQFLLLSQYFSSLDDLKSALSYFDYLPEENHQLFFKSFLLGRNDLATDEAVFNVLDFLCERNHPGLKAYLDAIKEYKPKAYLKMVETFYQHGVFDVVFEKSDVNAKEVLLTHMADAIKNNKQKFKFSDEKIVLNEVQNSEIKCLPSIMALDGSLQNIFWGYLKKHPEELIKKVLAQKNEDGWNAFYQALKIKSPVAKEIIVFLLDVVKKDKLFVFEMLSSLKEKGSDSSSAFSFFTKTPKVCQSPLMVALRSMPELVPNFLRIIKSLDLSQAISVLSNISPLGQSSLSIAISKKISVLDSLLVLYSFVPKKTLSSQLLAPGAFNPLALACQCNDEKTFITVIQLYLDNLGLDKTLHLFPKHLPKLDDALKASLFFTLINHYQKAREEEGLEYSSHRYFGIEFGYSNEKKLNVIRLLKTAIAEGDSDAFMTFSKSPEVAYCPSLQKMVALFAKDWQEKGIGEKTCKNVIQWGMNRKTTLACG